MHQEGPGGSISRPVPRSPLTPPSSDDELAAATYEAFLLTASPAQRAVIAGVGGLVSLLLGVCMAMVVLASPGTASERWVGLATATATIAIGVLVPRRGTALPLWFFDASLFLANVALAVIGVTGHPLVIALPGIYAIIGTAVFLLRSTRVAAFELLSVSASYGAVLWWGPSTDAALTRWLIVVSTVAISGLFIRWLVGRVQAVAAAEYAARRDAEAASLELTAASDAKAAFFSRMSHELRTPLNVVLGFGDVLRDQLFGPLNQRQVGYVDDIVASGRDLLGLVDELLDVSAVEAGSLAVELAPVEVSRAVSDALLLVRERAREAGVVVEFVPPAFPVIVEADARRLRQVVWNLIGNAIKFTPSGGKVAVTIRAETERVVVAVTDTGPGIDPAELPRMFEQFERGTTAAEGSGLGLPLCRRIIDSHRGHLWAQSKPGAGSTFAFDLPRQVAPAAPGASVDELDEVDAEIVAVMTARSLLDHVGAWFAYAAAFVLGAVALVTSEGPTWRLMTGGAALVSAVAAVLLQRGHGPRAVDVRWLGRFGVVAISVGAYLAGELHDIMALAYSWPAMAVGALYGVRHAALRVGFVAAAYAVVLVALDHRAGEQVFVQWFTLLVFVAGLTLVAWWTADRLRRMAVVARTSRLEAERARERLADIGRHQSDFVANTSHELCTPLNAVIGFAQVLSESMAGPLNAKQREYVDDILVAGRQLLALINDLLDLAKLEAGRMPLLLQSCVVETALENAINTVHPAAAARSVTVDLDAEPMLQDVHADPSRLHQVLVNLLGNAVKFTPDGGEVRVGAAQAPGFVVVTVSDTGIGISADQHDRVFDAFHQGSRAVPPHARGGTGLGLTLARGLVELQGGSISVASEPGRGSTFTMQLPVAVAIEQTARLPEEATT